MSDGGDVLKVDQEHLETVIPAMGTVVLVRDIYLFGDVSNNLKVSRNAC